MDEQEKQEQQEQKVSSANTSNHLGETKISYRIQKFTERLREAASISNIRQRLQPTSIPGQGGRPAAGAGATAVLSALAQGAG